MAEERRQAPRVPTRLTIFVKIAGAGKVHRVLTRDIGGNGLRFVLDEPLASGTTLELEIQLPDQAAPIPCTAEVVWSRPLTATRRSYEAPMMEVAVKFIDINPKHLKLMRQYAMLNAPPPEPRADA